MNNTDDQALIAALLNKPQKYASVYRPDLVHDEQTLRLANMIFGEGTGTGSKVQKMMGSTAINRLDSPRDKEFGSDMDSILNKRNAYYAVQNRNRPWRQATSLTFRNKKDEDEYFKTLALAQSLNDRTITPDQGLFFLKPKEGRSLRRSLNVINRVGAYDVLDYPKGGRK